MSPKRASPWGRPQVPNRTPLSATRPMLMLAWTAQVWKARSTSRCQAAVVPAWLRTLNRLLVRSPTAVPSGAKLRVSWVASGQGFPQVTGTQRSSRHSTVGRWDAVTGATPWKSIKRVFGQLLSLAAVGGGDREVGAHRSMKQARTGDDSILLTFFFCPCKSIPRKSRKRTMNALAVVGGSGGGDGGGG